MAYAATEQAPVELVPAPASAPVDLGLDFEPLPAPAPLTVPGEAVAQTAPTQTYDMPVAAGVTDLVDNGVPRPRVLMRDTANVLFLTQLYGQN
jgi:hypothetical protein